MSMSRAGKWSFAFMLCLAISFGVGAQTLTAPLLTAPTNGTGNEPLVLTLSWSSTTGATTYDVVVSTVSNFAVSVYNQQTDLTALSAVVSGLSAGITYFWRVDAGSTTATSAWSAMWSFGTAAALTAPAVPTLAAPTNGATGEPTSPTLSWNSAARATSYGVEVSISSTFATTLLDQTGLTGLTLVVPSLTPGTSYYWRVDASDAAGTSAYSAARSFTIAAAGTLPAPVLSTPTNGAAGQASSLTLSWGTVAAATSYALQVSTTSTFAVLVENQAGITAASFYIQGGTLTTGQTYYWQVNATNGTETSVWSSVWNFATEAAVAVPAVPVPTAPANAATGVVQPLTLTWNAAARATSYEAQVSTVSSFATTVFDEAGITALTATVGGLAIGTTYYWHVDASNATGTSAYSGSRTFTTGIAAPVLTSPASGNTTAKSPVTLVWGTVAGATSYNVEVSTDLTFATTVLTGTGLTAATATVTLASNQVYVWRVEAVDGAVATSAWSAASDFSIGLTGVLTENGPAAIAPSFAVKNGIISYSLDRTGPVAMAVFDLRGRSVFAFNHTQSAGNYAIELANRSVAPGRYFVWFKAGSFEKRTAMAFTGNR